MVAKKQKGIEVDRTTNQGTISRALHWLGDVTSRASIAALSALVVLFCAVFLAATNFPRNWVAGFSTAATSVTLVMLFVIQHTQSRQQLATQLKLDELIRATPEADDHLVHIEAAHELELIEREQDQLAHHEAVRDGVLDDQLDGNADS